jgi:hypothetical protein
MQWRSFDCFRKSQPSFHKMWTYHLLNTSSAQSNSSKLIIPYTKQRDWWLLIQSEWTTIMSRQKRINCIDQKASTYTYSLQCVRSEVKKIIYDRQNWRTHLVQQTLKQNLCARHIYKRVSDDIDDDLNHIDTKDLIRRSHDIESSSMYDDSKVSQI